MRVNLISSHRNQTGLAQDVDILQGMWHLADDTAKFRRVLHVQPECDQAEINVFFEVLSPSLFTYAARNIWIPNPEWAYKSWTASYMHAIDEIWCKTHEAYEIFSKVHPTVKYIGWTSIAKGIPETKNFHKALLLVGKNIYRHPQLIVDAYSAANGIKLPELHIIYDSTRMKLDVPENLTNVKVYPNTLKDSEYNEIVDDCGLAICISGAEGFGHAVNEAASSGCVLMLNEIAPFKEFGYEGVVWVPNSKSVDHPECLGVIAKTEKEDVMDALSRYAELKFKDRKTMSEQNATAYTKRHSEWTARMREFLKDYSTDEIYSVQSTLPAEDDLPGVTIVTPTRDRMKFMEICAGCVNSQCYPTDKLEWLVIDDGKDTCEEFVKSVPFGKHIIQTAGKTIAWKRNLGCRLAKFPVIVHMDDDDIYPPNSILFRVSMMLRAKKEAVFCTTISCYDIKNYISFVNVPPMRLPQSMRVSEATLCHTKKFWEEQGFEDDVKIAEGNTFIRGREHMCGELSPQEIIVSLVHPWTTSSRKAPKGMEANGCHFGFTDDLFEMLSKIGGAATVPLNDASSSS